MSGRDEFIQTLKVCAFDLDTEGNVGKSNNLMLKKTKIQKKLFDLEVGYEKAKNKLYLDEKVQAGKNAEIRGALMALELEGTKFDVIDELKMYLGIIASIEHHNNNVLHLYFKENK